MQLDKDLLQLVSEAYNESNPQFAFVAGRYVDNSVRQYGYKRVFNCVGFLFEVFVLDEDPSVNCWRGSWISTELSYDRSAALIQATLAIQEAMENKRNTRVRLAWIDEERHSHFFFFM